MPHAAGLLRGRLPDSAESEPEIPIKRSDLRLTCSFVAEVLATFVDGNADPIRFDGPRRPPLA